MSEENKKKRGGQEDIVAPQGVPFFEVALLLVPIQVEWGVTEAALNQDGGGGVRRGDLSRARVYLHHSGSKGQKALLLDTASIHSVF